MLERGVTRLARRSLATLQRGYRDGERVVPEFVKGRGQVGNDGAGGKHIVVRELRFGIHLKILIADVAATDHRHRIVDHQQLVMHAVIETLMVNEEFRSAQCQRMSAVSEWIEYPQLDAWIAGQGRDPLVARPRVAIIEQDAHTYAARSSARQRRAE